MHLIGESSGTCFLIGLFFTVPVPVTPTEQHPLLQGAGTPSVPWRLSLLAPVPTHREDVMSGSSFLPEDTRPVPRSGSVEPCPFQNLELPTPLLLMSQHHGGTLTPQHLGPPHLLFPFCPKDLTPTILRSP